MDSSRLFALTKQDTNALKGIAIIAMLCHHLFAFPPEWANLPDSPFLLWLGSVGKVCVAIFLFCSGYGLSVQCSEKQPDGAKGMARFLVRRIGKFYANYWVIFLLFVPVTVVLFNRPLSAAYGESANVPFHLVLDWFGLQGVHSYNVTWWFNLLILLYYLFFPVVYYGCRKNVWITLVLALVCCVVGGKCEWLYGQLFFDYILPFTMGVAWSFCQNVPDRIALFLSRNKYLFVILCVIALAVTVFFRQHKILPCGFYSVKMDGFITCSLALLISALRPFFSPTGVLSLFGKHSANIYLMHTFFNAYWPTSIWIHQYLSGLGKFVVLFSGCFLISLVLEWMKNRTKYNFLVLSILNKVR